MNGFGRWTGSLSSGGGGAGAGSNANHSSSGGGAGGSSSGNATRSHRVRFPDIGTHHHHHHSMGGSAQPGMLGFDSTSSSTTTSPLTDPGGVLTLLADIVTALLAHVCLAGLSTILVLLYVTVRPFSQQAYRRLAAQWGASSLIDAVALLLPNTRIVLTGDSDVPSSVGTSIMVSNHFMDADWWAILLMSRCIGLRGSVKVILRNEYLHVNVGSNTTTNGATSDASSSSTQTGSTANGTTTVVATPTTNGSNSSNNNNIISTVGVDSTSSSSSSPTAASSTAHHSHHHYQHHPHHQQQHHQGPQDLALMAKLLHLFLEFPLMNGEQDYISNRNQMFQLLRSFATDETEPSSAERSSSSNHSSHSTGAAAPVHLLFFPEGWCLHSSSTSDRQSILAKSNEFAQREGRPQLRHLLLPRARGFNASLECLRESTPVVYDVTMVRTYVLKPDYVFIACRAMRACFASRVPAAW